MTLEEKGGFIAGTTLFLKVPVSKHFRLLGPHGWFLSQ